MLLDAAQAPFAPDKAIIFIDMVQQASQDFWRSHNPEALAMVEGAGLQVCHRLHIGNLAYCC